MGALKTTDRPAVDEMKAGYAKQRSTSEKGLFIAVDASPASARAVNYVAGFLCGHSGFRITLVHIPPPFPPELLEHGGAENPAKEEELQTELRDQQRQWTLAAKKSVEKSLKNAQSILREAGITEECIRILFCEPCEVPDAADSILNMARECNCRTIVIGRELSYRFHELFGQELAQELLRRGKGFSIWVIE